MGLYFCIFFVWDVVSELQIMATAIFMFTCPILNQVEVRPGRFNKQVQTSAACSKNECLHWVLNVPDSCLT